MWTRLISLLVLGNILEILISRYDVDLILECNYVLTCTFGCVKVDEIKE